MQKIFKKWEPEDSWGRIGYFIALNLVFLNVLFSEVLMFSEMSIYFGLGYLLAAAGVWMYTRKKYLSMLLCFVVAACTYQYTMIFAAILIAFYICLAHGEKLTLKAVKDELLGVVSCVGMGGLNYLSIRMLEKLGLIAQFNKSAGVGNIGQKLADFGSSLLRFHQSSLGIMPNLWIPLLFTVGVVVLMVYNGIKNKSCKSIFYILVVALGCIILLYMIPMIQGIFNFPPRMAFCFYLLQGLLVVTVFAVSQSEVRKLLSLGCILYLMIQLFFSHIVVTNHFVSNTLDEVYVNMMYQEILKYEEETGIQVTKLAVCKDAYSPDNYQEVHYHSHQINERSLGTATLSLIQKETGRSFEQVGNYKEIYEQYFKGKNWDYLDLSQQLFIIGDTAYWCIF